MTPLAFADAVFELYLEGTIDFARMGEFTPPELDRRYWPVLATLGLSHMKSCDQIERLENRANFLESHGKKPQRLWDFIRLIRSRHDGAAVSTDQKQPKP